MMVRRLAVAALVVLGMIPLAFAFTFGFAFGVAAPVSAQEPPACASAVWLDPLAAAASAEAAAAPADAPAWFTTELHDACTDQTFTLADFAGKTLFIEPMATWCTTCHAQMTRVTEAAARIPAEQRGEIVLVALSSEVDLPRADLAAYAEANDFPFIFAVMTADMLRAMAEDLGQEVAVPPATPHLIVSPDGTIGALRTGSTSSDDLLALFTAAAAAEAS